MQEHVIVTVTPCLITKEKKKKKKQMDSFESNRCGLTRITFFQRVLKSLTIWPGEDERNLHPYYTLSTMGIL